MNRNRVGLLLLVFFIVSLVSAVPPPFISTAQTFSEGYAIVDSPLTYLKQNQDLTYNFFVHNISNGVSLGNSSCSCIFYLANSTGNLLYYGSVPFSLGYWHLVIRGGNFSYNGEFDYGVNCNSTNLGGTLAKRFIVTPEGAEEVTAGRGNLIALSILVIILFAIILLVIGLLQKNLFLKLFFISFALIFMIAATLYTFVILEQTVFISSIIQEGFGSFWFVVKIMISIMITGLILFTFFIAFIAWKNKRGLR